MGEVTMYAVLKHGVLTDSARVLLFPTEREALSRRDDGVNHYAYEPGVKVVVPVKVRIAD